MTEVINLNGIDISHWQTGINFNNIKKNFSFAILREGCGDEIDQSFLEYVKQAKAAGVQIPAVYHFIYALTDAEVVQNAEAAIKNIKAAGLPDTTVIWCDLEYDTADYYRKKTGKTLTEATQKKWATLFCDEILKRGYPTGIYVNADYMYRVYGTGIGQKYDLWLSDLSSGPDWPCVYQQTGYTRVDGWPWEVDADTYIGQYTAGTAKPQKKEGKTEMILEKKLTDDLVKLASGNPPSSYKAAPPWNLLYWDGKRWWADCVNLYKALFNGRSIENPATGSFQSDLSKTGDCTEWGLLQQCTDRSQDFKMLGDHFRCLYMDGHFGGYLGFELTIPGQGVVNVVESTPRWEDGIQYSYVDTAGRRSWYKGAKVEGVWTWHGLATKWISYGADPQPEPEKKRPWSIDNLAVHIIRGDLGSGEERKQKIYDLGYTEAERQQAQGIVDFVYEAYGKDKLAADIAMKFISGEAGDGAAARKKWVKENYDDESLYTLAQEKVNQYLSS